jgi:hypothetical protein
MTFIKSINVKYIIKQYKKIDLFYNKSYLVMINIKNDFCFYDL